MIDVTKRIQEIMDLKGWSPYELANRAGISTNTVYDWFKKGAAPTMQNVMKVCKEADISLEYFFCDGAYRYTEEENRILRKWFALSELEKSAVMKLMKTIEILKNH